MPVRPHMMVTPAGLLLTAVLLPFALAATPAGAAEKAAATTTGVAQDGAAQCLPTDVQPVTPAEVIDGDTLRLTDGIVVRLAGIEAPKRPLDMAEASRLESAARAALERLTAGGRVAIAPVAEGTDRYGRVVADVFVNDGEGGTIWVQERLVAQGLARVRRPDGDPACAARLYQAERAAMVAKRAMWADKDYAVKDARDASLAGRKGLYEVVEGRVLSVGRRTYMTFVDFGRDYRRDFTIMITPAMVDRLAEKGVPVEMLDGQLVRVRGVIESSGGPAIRLKRVDEFELLTDAGQASDLK